MKYIGFWRRTLVALGLYLTLTIVYTSTNFWTIYRESHLVHIPIDNYIPFIPHAIYIYIFGFILLLGYPILFIAEKRDFSLLVKGILWLVLTTGIVYCIFPTSMSRPELPITDRTTYFLSIFHKIDPPHNSFPSIHVSLVTFISVFLHQKNYWKTYPLIIAFFVGLSTLLTKQHALIDVLSGLLHGHIALYIFNKNLDNRIIYSDTDDKIES